MRRAAALLLPVLLAGGAGGAAAGGTPPAWEPAKTWALFVGVLEWQDPSYARFPKEGRWDRVLEKTLLARGVPRDHVTFLEDREATLAACREALARIAAAAGDGSTLLFYYAGHGGPEGGKTYFAPYDADPKRFAATGFGVDDVGATLAARWRGSRLFLTADCCHSGALGEVVHGLDAPGRAKACSLTSALATNLSTGNWTFTESLVAVLSGDGAPDANGDGAVDFGEADAFVRREMRFRESQLTEAQATASFERGLVLSRVDPARARRRVPGPWQIGEYGEASWKGEWWKAQVLDADAARVRVHYLGFDATWDEWVEAKRLRPVAPLAAKAGDALEVEWEGTWWPASVARVRDEFAFVHYDGWGPEWDEWVGAKRMRPRAK